MYICNVFCLLNLFARWSKNDEELWVAIDDLQLVVSVVTDSQYCTVVSCSSCAHSCSTVDMQVCYCQEMAVPYVVHLPVLQHQLSTVSPNSETITLDNLIKLSHLNGLMGVKLLNSMQIVLYKSFSGYFDRIIV